MISSKRAKMLLTNRVSLALGRGGVCHDLYVLGFALVYLIVREFV